MDSHRSVAIPGLINVLLCLYGNLLLGRNLLRQDFRRRQDLDCCFILQNVTLKSKMNKIKNMTGLLFQNSRVGETYFHELKYFYYENFRGNWGAVNRCDSK